MPDDIVTRLRHMAWTAPEGEPWADALRDAADEIERLRESLAEITKLRQRISELEDRVSDLEQSRG